MDSFRCIWFHLTLVLSLQILLPWSVFHSSLFLPYSHRLGFYEIFRLRFLHQNLMQGSPHSPFQYACAIQQKGGSERKSLTNILNPFVVNSLNSNRAFSTAFFCKLSIHIQTVKQEVRLSRLRTFYLQYFHMFALFPISLDDGWTNLWRQILQKIPRHSRSFTDPSQSLLLPFFFPLEK